MNRPIDAVFEGGVFRPLAAPVGIAEHAHVRLTVEPVAGGGQQIADCVGSLPDADAAELLAIVEQEFGRVDPLDWQ